MKRFVSLSFLLAWLGVAAAQNFFQQSDVQWVALPDSPDWTYSTGQRAVIDVQVLRYGMPLDDVEIRYTVGNDCLDSDMEGTVRTANGHATILAGTAERPGFRDCVMQCEVDGKTYRNHVKMGFSPDGLTPFTQLPIDFDIYWKNVLKEQQKVPLEATVTPEPRYSTDKVDCSLVKLRCYSPQGEYYIYGYLTKPKAEGKYPVVINPPGAGVKPMDPKKTLFYAEQGMVRLDLEIHGIDPALPASVYREISLAFGEHHAGGYLANGITARDTYYMRKVYASLVRAVDFMTSLPEWDGRNVFVQGNSQGGALSIVLAALDKRVTAIAVAHPALADMAAYSESGRTGGYPHFGRKYRDVKLTEAVVKTLQYYDVVNFARRVSCPVMMTYGYNDNVCPPTTSSIVYNVLTAPKERIVTPINEHWISTRMRQQQLDFLKKHVQ